MKPQTKLISFLAAFALLLGLGQYAWTAETNYQQSTVITAEEFFSLPAEQQIADYEAMDPETAYQVIEESDCSWCVTSYDEITPENVKDFVVIYEKDDGSTAFNLDWPVYGGYDPESIASIKDLSGKISVDRSGGEGGFCLGYGTRPDGSQYTMSERSVPMSSGEVQVGTMDVDLYKKTAEIVSGSGTDEEKVEALLALGIEEEPAKQMLSDYTTWLGRSEIAGPNNISDGAASVGHTVDPNYGYYGKTKAWLAPGLEMKGGSGQMNTIYSWKTLKESGIVTDVHTEEVGW